MIHLAENRDKWPGLVGTAMNLEVTCWKFLQKLSVASSTII